MDENFSSPAVPVRARLFYHWRKPGCKERHGFSMGVFDAADRREESLIEAVKSKHGNLKDFDIVIDRIEWR
jgi:hypothetical protein